jgi:hypothetical protein
VRALLLYVPPFEPRAVGQGAWRNRELLDIYFPPARLKLPQRGKSWRKQRLRGGSWAAEAAHLGRLAIVGRVEPAICRTAILAAVPIAASAVIVIVDAVEEDAAAPEPAMPTEIAIPVSQAGEAPPAADGVIAANGIIATVSREVAAASGEIARASAAYTSTAASVPAAGKHERAIAVRGRCSEECACRQRQAKSRRRSYDCSFYMHGVPFQKVHKPFPNEEHQQPQKFPSNS